MVQWGESYYRKCEQGVVANLKCLTHSLEAGAGIEPAVELLQSSALPLGDPAAIRVLKI